jgi:hypothetical protein
MRKYKILFNNQIQHQGMSANNVLAFYRNIELSEQSKALRERLPDLITEEKVAKVLPILGKGSQYGLGSGYSVALFSEEVEVKP